MEWRSERASPSRRRGDDRRAKGSASQPASRLQSFELRGDQTRWLVHVCVVDSLAKKWKEKGKDEEGEEEWRGEKTNESRLRRCGSHLIRSPRLKPHADDPPRRTSCTNLTVRRGDELSSCKKSPRAPVRDTMERNGFTVRRRADRRRRREPLEVRLRRPPDWRLTISPNELCCG